MEQGFMNPKEQNVLASIFDGMEVFDADGHKVGTVDYVYMGSVHGKGTGSATAEPPADRTPGLMDDLARAIDPADQIPEEIRHRLDYEGFIRVDNSRLLGADRYVLPSQINSVDGNRVMLNARYDDLAKD